MRKNQTMRVVPGIGAHLEHFQIFVVDSRDPCPRTDNAGYDFFRTRQNLFAPSNAEEIAFVRRRALTASQGVEHTREYTFVVWTP